MATVNPFRLSDATRFRPLSFRGHARTPSRSPVRKSLFLAKEVDPFLSNLSPESTLRALRATSTITEGGAGQDLLAQSIADASPEEREIGIRAALTAQKLKQWRYELEHWPWPSVRDRRSGAGFLLPRRPSVPSLVVLNDTHAGYLPTASIQEYQDKIEDIRDGIEAFELEDIKDHIFSAHPAPSLTAGLEESAGVQTSFGKLRDFTALVIATVVQALPDMAHVNMLLDTWDIRLSILRQIPSVEAAFKSLRANLQAARSQIRDEQSASAFDFHAFESRNTALSKAVSSLGSTIDNLLDLLEGQEDTLPKTWIDSLEDLENDYAGWVTEARHIAEQRSMNLHTLTKQPSIQIHGPDRQDPRRALESESPISSRRSDRDVVTPLEDDLAREDIAEVAELPNRDLFAFPLSRKAPESSMHARKPSLSIKPSGHNHNRHVSEISMADSALSGMSDLSNAEIIDARSTQLMLSPKISVVDNPLRNSRDTLSWFRPDESNDEEASKPPVVHRASTASIKVVAKDSVRPVTVIRSQSLDLLNGFRHSPPSTPSRALRQLMGIDSPSLPADFQEVLDEVTRGSPSTRRKSSMSRHPSLMVEPLAVKPKDIDRSDTASPAVPRRSSRRVYRTRSAEAIVPSSPSDTVEPHTPVDAGEPFAFQVQTTSPSPKSLSNRKSTSLEEKIKDILTTIPTKIRLAHQTDEMEADRQQSTPSTRSSTPAPILTISPAKADRSNRKAPSGDVRVFHLTRSGQNQDAAPVKLFVRAVGENGERVMVRVGGGWADLAEYLREYSLHHGHRVLASDQLEVASLPSATKHKSPVATVTAAADDENDQAGGQAGPRRKFSLSGLTGLAVGRSRKSSRGKLLEAEEASNNESDIQAPVSPLSGPHYAIQSSTVVSQTRSEARLTRPNLTAIETGSKNVVSPKHGGASLVSPVSTLSPNSIGSPAYTPLGAAGPKTNSGSLNSRRAASYNTLNSGNEAWVEGMLGQARAVSGTTSTTISTSTVHSPTLTVTTKSGYISKSTKSRYSSLNSNSSALSSFPSNSSFGLGLKTSPGPALSPSLAPTNSSTITRSKSRMGLGDVGNIKRVFLRRKSEKV